MRHLTTTRDRRSAKYLRKHSELRADVEAAKAPTSCKRDRKRAASILFRNQGTIHG